MNPYLPIAETYIKETAGAHFTIVPNSIRDLTDFYCFTSQTRTYLETGSIQDMAIGMGYCLIYKADHRIFAFSSGYSLDAALQSLRPQISQEQQVRQHFPHFDIQQKFDLRITSMEQPQILLDSLMENRPQYVVPEVVGSSIFCISKSYKPKLLKKRLAHLPTTFHGLNQHQLPTLILNLKATACCQFELVLHEPRIIPTYSDQASAKDLEPVW
ncbi:hypothetical protein [Pontibacter sp. G13]|uniref:hypothetical protein n=1 Tax=Pontibacter sp. G13 TaxID=3074898 RepID=UPI00288A4D90|nr:hypothetical protein [Pontibacter sp. G13]WNJ17887.1 hypothetical protein RJD25_23790 [Pontibacter sp. G13]